jgi:hypothetical protein
MGFKVPQFAHFEFGTCNTIDDESGFKVKLSATMLRWEGYIVTEEFWEPRQPQDFPVTPRPPKSYNNARQEQLPVFVSGDEDIA